MLKGSIIFAVALTVACIAAAAYLNSLTQRNINAERQGVCKSEGVKC